MRLSSIIAETSVEPRPYQIRVVSRTTDLMNGLEKNGVGEPLPPAKSVLVESPTGSGKTIMGLLIAKAMQERYPDLAVGWMAMRSFLLEQAADENKRHGINVRDFMPVSMFCHQPEELLEAKRAGRPVLMVCDEAQHDAANSAANLHNVIRPDYVLGLSATPFRADNMKLCFDKVVKDAGIHQLIQDGFLSKFDHYTIPKWTPEWVTQMFCERPDYWGKSAFYWLKQEDSRQFADLMRAEGHEVLVVDDPKVFEGQLDRFKSGDCRLISNCMKLTEGFDDPSLETAWVRDGSQGPTMQMAGRAFRKHDSIPTKKIVQSSITKWPIMRTAHPNMQWIFRDGAWLSLELNDSIREIERNCLMAVAQADTELPDYLRKVLRSVAGGVVIVMIESPVRVWGVIPHTLFKIIPHTQFNIVWGIVTGWGRGNNGSRNFGTRFWRIAE